MNIKSARGIQEWVRILGRDGDKPIQLSIPGHDGKVYEVLLSRPENGILVVECRYERCVPCPGNSYGQVCYHSLAAVMASASEWGYLHVFNSYDHAMSVEGFLGKLVVVKAQKGGGVAYCRFYRHAKKKVRKIAVTLPGPVVVPQQGQLFDTTIGPYDRGSGH